MRKCSVRLCLKKDDLKAAFLRRRPGLLLSGNFAGSYFWQGKYMFLDALLDALKDTLIALPFLFLAYLLVEALERHTDFFTKRFYSKSQVFGPLLGSLMGLIPQCAFSAAMSNLYVGGVVGIGTLMAVFLSTSDEAVLILLSSPGAAKEIWKLLLVKFIIGVFFGYLLALIFRNKKIELKKADKGKKEEGEEHGIAVSALIHTGKIILWVFGITLVLNIIIGLIGTENLSRVLGGELFIQPLITALFGLIPNCAISVVLTELYMAGGLSFASMTAGLCSATGVGLIVLFKSSANKKDCVLITLLLYACSAVSGLILNFIPI